MLIYITTNNSILFAVVKEIYFSLKIILPILKKTMHQHLQNLLQQRTDTNLYRQRLCHETKQQPELMIDGEKYLSFCSNDYLGLAVHPKLIKAWQEGAEIYGVGSGASHLVTGHTQAHHALEEELAAFMRRERALLFSTGYMANVGVLSALLSRHDAVFTDKLNHASLIDGALLSRAKVQRFPHNDMERLAYLLANTSARHKLIVVDGVFSMDGDLADLPAIVKLAHQHNAWVMVDDAHGFGAVGKTGRGTLEHFNLSVKDVQILMGTLGKAAGVSGAFVAGDEVLIEALIQSARSYIYTTALPPALAHTLRESVHILDNEPQHREQLNDLIAYFKQQAQQYDIELMPSDTAIQPIVIGDAGRALALSQRLKAEHQLIVTAIRPPTVPGNTARLRITLCSLHTKENIDYLMKALIKVLN